MRILYVEDNLTNVSLVKRIAKSHEVISYIDGEDALKNFDKDKPDLILMDVQLAGKLTGLDVVRELRQQGHEVPIIAVTAYAMLGDREKCLEAGCNDYVAKPLPIPRMVELIQHYDKLLKQKQAESTDAAATTAEKQSEEKSTKTAPELDTMPDMDSSETASVEVNIPKIAPAKPSSSVGETKSTDEAVSAVSQEETETAETPKPTVDHDATVPATNKVNDGDADASNESDKRHTSSMCESDKINPQVDENIEVNNVKDSIGSG